MQVEKVNIRQVQRWRSYSNIAVGLNVVHPEDFNSPSFTEKLLHSLQGEGPQELVYSEGISQRFLWGRD